MKRSRTKLARAIPKAGHSLLTPLVAFSQRWNFHERRDRTELVISGWIAAEHWSPKTRANFDRALDHLKALSKTMWHKPHPASKIGNHIYVIRFKDTSSAQLRVFGHFFDDHHTFVMTFDGYEKDDVYYPDGYQDVAERHRKACDNDFARRTAAFEEYCDRCNEAAHRNCS